MRIFALLLFCIGHTSATCWADDRNYVVMGVGAHTCGQFATEYAKNPVKFEFTYFDWAQGFMSGLNAASDAYSGTYRNLASFTIDEQMARLRAYVITHP